MKNVELVYINISDCKINGDVTEKLCEIILTHNRNLSSLLISNNTQNSDAGDQRAQSIAKLISHHPKL